MIARTRLLRLALLLVALTPALARAAVEIQVAADRPDALYAKGEPVTFRIALVDGKKPVAGKELAYTITKDGFGDIAKGTVTSANKPVEVKSKLDEPGFLRIDVTYAADATTKPVAATGGAGVDPHLILPSLPVPDDFDAFWEKQKELLASNPAEPKFTKVESSDPSIDAFDVQIPTPAPGNNVSGYYAKPKGAKPKSLPAILYPHSAGVRDSSLNHAVRGAKFGAIALDFNAHGIPNGKPESFYKGLAAGELKDYRGRGAEDRDTVYFRGMFLRLQRATDFLTSQPEWDGRVLIVEGSSQGGGQALVAAGLDSRVTLCLASVPAICDHTGFVVDRTPGWPRLVPKGADGKFNEKATRAARYVDAMNFATRIQCPTVVSVGFIDKTCPATSVYAAYNAIPEGVEKTIVNRPAMGHVFPADIQKDWDRLIEEHIAEMKAPVGAGAAE